jgi:CheY-like chemotaxis protein
VERDLPLARSDAFLNCQKPAKTPLHPRFNVLARLALKFALQNGLAKAAVLREKTKTTKKQGKRVMNATFKAPEPMMKWRTAKPAKRKILLADDDPAMRQVLRRLLSEENFLVLTASDGAKALELVNLTRFDLVLLDLKAQAEEGWEIFGQLSAQNPLLPVVLITDHPNQFFHAVASGIGALLEKPLNFTRLFHTIHNLLQEPAEERLARFMGQPAAFHHIPPSTGAPQKIWRVN